MNSIKRNFLINKINNLPKELKEIIFLCRKIAKQQNIEIYLVGGFVRDLLLEEKNFDLDIVVEKGGIEFATMLSRQLHADLVKHRPFGTATLNCKNGYKIDIATSRKETYLKPAALPTVEAGTIRDDLARRDFSINAMACHIDYQKFGMFVDFFGGWDDLKNKKIRVLHQRSFIDDPTRIMRAVRFEQRFGFKIEKNTLRLIKEAKNQKLLERVQKHRIRDELILIFKEDNPFRIIRRLRQVYNLTFINPKIKFNSKLETLYQRIKNTAIWFNKKFPNKRKPELWLMYLAVFLSSLKITALNNFLITYAFLKSDKIRILSFIKKHHSIIKRLRKRSIMPAHIFQLLEPLSYEVILLCYGIAIDKIVKQRISYFFQYIHSKQLSITGDDLLLLGAKPGPNFKKILQKVLHYKINKKLRSKEQELEYAKKIINSQIDK